MSSDRRTFLKRVGVATGLSAGGVAGAAASTARSQSIVDDWVPAAGTNFRRSNRGPGDIDWIVMHVAATSYRGTINLFANPNPRRVSSHYVVSNYAHTAGEPGHVTKMVDESDVSHHAGAANRNSIGIEHEWSESLGQYISDECYRASARLVRQIATEYDVPLDYYDSHTCTTHSRGGIIGHLHTPSNGGCTAWNSHNRTCPYPDWNWGTFMRFLREEDVDENPAFEERQTVVSTKEATVRRSAEIPADGRNVVHTQPPGVEGTVLNGPHTADGFVWWWVQFENGVGGWTAQDQLGEPSEWNGGEPPSYKIGTNVRTVETATIRTSAEVANNVVHTQPTGVNGTIANGYVSADGFTWWWVEFENGVGGWTAQRRIS